MNVYKAKRKHLMESYTPDAAGARCIIKRALRGMGLPVGESEEYVGWFIAHPWACTKGIERTIEQSARAWERGNNSGDNRTLERECAKEKRFASYAECLLSALGVKLDWPGLYPTYQVNGRTSYDLAGLWRDLKQERATEIV